MARRETTAGSSHDTRSTAHFMKRLAPRTACGFLRSQVRLAYDEERYVDCWECLRELRKAARASQPEPDVEGSNRG